MDPKNSADIGAIGDALDAGRRIDRLCIPVAAWLQFVRSQAANGVALVDPLSKVLSDIGGSTTGDAHHDVAAFLAADAVFASLSGDARVVEAVQAALRWAGLGNATSTEIQLTIDSR